MQRWSFAGVNHISIHSWVSSWRYFVNYWGCCKTLIHLDGTTTCSASGLVCLSLTLWPKHVTCKCRKTCSELVYTQNSLRKTNWAADTELTMLDKKSSVRYEIVAQKIRFRRDILFSFEDLIVSLGGIASLFLGYNFLNSVEIFYYVLNISIKYCFAKFYSKWFFAEELLCSISITQQLKKTILHSLM